MPDDIYPLGQDRGLIPDILNFGLNSLYQHFRAPEPSGTIGGEMRAQDILEKAGSVMARPQLPEWRRESPLLNTAMGMVDKALSFDPWHQILNVDPKMQMSPMEAIANVGGAENAIFGPIRTPWQKQAVRAAWRHDPEHVLAAQADPQVLNITVPKPNVENAKAFQDVGWMPEGTTAAFEPQLSELRVAPATMVGGHYKAPLLEGLSDLTNKIMGLNLPPSWLKPRIVSGPGGTTHLPEAMGHEISHFLNRDRVYSEKHWQDAPDILEALAPLLNEHSIKSAIEGGLEHKNPSVAIDEMLAYLSGQSTRNPATEDIGRLVHQFLKVRTAPSGNVGAAITPDAVRASIRMATEAADPVYGQAARAQWDKLAKENILPAREMGYQAHTPFNKAFPDNPLFSMRQRTEPASMYERLPRAGRTFTSAEDLSRAKAGEELPALGSAMPDIPRPVSSPGGLDFFENLRAKLGLEPADLGGVAPEFYGKKTPPSSLLESKRGGRALDDLYENIVRERLLDRTKYTKDDFMRETLNNLADATAPRPGLLAEQHPKEAGLPTGVKRFRWRMRPMEESGMMGKDLGAEPSLDILDHLQQYGLLEKENLEKALTGGPKYYQPRFVDPEGLQRIKDLMERVQYDPKTGATKGNPTRLLPTKAGGDALKEIWQDWSTAGYGGTPNQVPQDRFMDTVLEALARATQSPSVNAQKMFPYPAGVSGFRRSITPEEKMFGGGKHSPFPHDAQKSLDILEHLREYGFLEPGVLEEALKSTRGQAHRVLGQATPVDPAGLERIKRLLERVGR